MPGNDTFFMVFANYLISAICVLNGRKVCLQILKMDKKMKI